MFDELNPFVALIIGLLAVFGLTFLIGVVLDIRQGKFGLLLGLLGLLIVVGLVVYPALAQVAAILFVGAWLAGILKPVAATSTAGAAPSEGG